MLLGEALVERKGKAAAIQGVGHRIQSVARYQEGDLPAEDARTLLEEARQAARNLGSLVYRINKTNATATLTYAGQEITIMEAIARRDALTAERELVSDAASAAVGSRSGFMWRQTRTELRTMTDLPVGYLRTAADDLARQRRELDTLIQQANWNTQLAD